MPGGRMDTKALFVNDTVEIRRNNDKKSQDKFKRWFSFKILVELISVNGNVSTFLA
jgi:hypothetical protein